MSRLSSTHFESERLSTGKNPIGHNAESQIQDRDSGDGSKWEILTESHHDRYHRLGVEEARNLPTMATVSNLRQKQAWRLRFTPFSLLCGIILLSALWWIRSRIILATMCPAHSFPADVAAYGGYDAIAAKFVVSLDDLKNAVGYGGTICVPKTGVFYPDRVVAPIPADW